MANRLAGDLRKGDTFELDGTVQVVVDFQHVKPGKGAAFVRVKMRNVMTGSVLERTFNPSEKFDLAYIERKKMTYSYADGDLYYFMDNETYDMLAARSRSSPKTSSFCKSLNAIPVSPAQPRNPVPRARLWKPAIPFKYLCSSTKAI